MPRWFNILVQVAGFGTEILNLWLGFIPREYQAQIVAAITAIQGTVAIIAHHYNPDGTSARVAYRPKEG